MTHTIALLGGTGPEGRGLATRFALAGHRVIIGSRQADRGAAAATAVAQSIPQYAEALSGTNNAEAVASAEIVVITVPYKGHASLIESLRDELAGKTVVDAVVPVRFERGPRPVDVAAGSATEEAAELLPESRVVGAFHTLPAELLLDPTKAIDSDVLVTGDDADAKRLVSALAEQIDGVRAVDAGPLRFSRFVEQITLLLIGINGHYDAHTGVRIAGLPGGD
jgi:NADPH-dependent F420 reductase